MASSVSLGDKLEAFISEAVRSGRYGSRSEVLREGVRLVQERETRLHRLEAEIQMGIDSAERGELIDVDEAFDRVVARIRKAAGRRAA